jgi:hypothetical protein
MLHWRIGRDIPYLSTRPVYSPWMSSAAQACPWYTLFRPLLHVVYLKRNNSDTVSLPCFHKLYYDYKIYR